MNQEKIKKDTLTESNVPQENSKSIEFKRNELLLLIKNTKELTEKEKKSFIIEIEEINPSEFLEVYEIIINNFDKIIDVLKLKGSIIGAFEKIEEIEDKIKLLEKETGKSIKKHEEKVNENEKKAAGENINSYFV